MGTASFPKVYEYSARGATLTPQTLLVLWSRKSRAIALLPLWVVRPIQSLSACTKVHFTFTFCLPELCPDFELIPEGNTVNLEIYIEDIPCLKDAVRTKLPEKWISNCWFLLYDNAPAHQPVLVKDFLAKKKATWQHSDIPHTLLTWLRLIFICSLDCNQHWNDGTFVTLLTSLKIRRKSWGNFNKMLSRNVSNMFTVADQRGLFWKEISLNDFAA